MAGVAATGTVIHICIGNLNNFFSDRSYIAEPARCQSRERLVKIGFCFCWLGRCGGRKHLTCSPPGCSRKLKPSGSHHSGMVEFSRTCVATAYRGSKLAYGLIDGIAALACEDGVRYVLGSCDVRVASLYQSFGYSRLADAPAQIFPEVGIESCSLFGDLEELPLRHKEIVENFRQKLRHDGYMSQCATPACFRAHDYAETHKHKYRCPLIDSSLTDQIR